MPPRPHTNWTGKADARAFAPDCVQTGSWFSKIFQVGLLASTSEDCLFINAWAPDNSNGSA